MTSADIGWTDPSGERHTRRFTIKPIPEPFQAVYRRRGIEIPLGNSGHPLAALWPYEYRTLHQLYAKSHGYFWLPCVLCALPFGGHEISDTIPDPTRGPGAGILICPACSARRNGGKP